jgi:hypothetical protein
MYVDKSLSNDYYVCLTQNQEPIPWQNLVAAQKFNLDYNLDYFAKIFEEMEKSLEIDGLTFYITRDIHELPSYGQNVIAIVLGDEWCRIPTYFHKVRAIFKCYGTRPILGCNPLLQPSYLNILALVQYLRIWLLRLPGLLNYAFHTFKRWRLSTAQTPPIYDIPLGYYKQFELPIKNLETRLYDIFFAGSMVNVPYSVWSLKYWFGTPKNLSRKQMLSSLEKFQAKHPELKVELSLTPSFHATKHEEARIYSERMMDTKICLVPRGTSFETFRFFEGLRYGCIVVAEALPSRWFYDGSPAIRIKDWSELGEIVEKLIENNYLMQEKHQEALNWWRTKCSEATVGAYMAEKLNSLRSPS